jgi:5'-nucleotidase
MLASCAVQRGAPPEEFTLSILGTNDVHGQLLPLRDRGGLVTISAYVDALRDARVEDGGAVLVIDAGDMWQGTLDSNLVEGAAVVEAYNAIGFTAAAIGNHEFDFGPVGSKAIPQDAGDDPQGALKQRVSEANFPVLAANLIDEKTGRPVEWDNVRPSTLVDVAGVRVGIIGVVTEQALQATISANTAGVRIAPLVETIREEATRLRQQGATIIVVSAHAGGDCTEFENPMDLSSCNMGGEIMRVATALPTGLVDHIIGGHVHGGIAHIVNGISITSSYSNTRAFSRVDLEVDRNAGTITSRKVFPPHWACLRVVRTTGVCATPSDNESETANAVYEGRAIEANPEVMEIAIRAAAHAEETKEKSLGVYLESAFEHPPSTESPLANLMTDAIRETVGGDIAIHNVVGGIRSILPQGELTFGSVYEMFPFDNQVVVLDLSGRQVREIIATQAHKNGRRAGFSGMRVFIDCTDGQMDIEMKLRTGATIHDDDRVAIVANDFLALGGDDVLTPVLPDGGFDVDDSMPLTRDVLVDWFRSKTGSLNPDDYLSTEEPRWNLPDELPATCSL